MTAALIHDLLLLLGGLLGSAHCIGMCGGFVLTLGGDGPHWTRNLGRQLLYASGRISVYVLAGAMVGFTSWRVGLATQTLIRAQAILSILAGVILVYEGALALGWLRRGVFGVSGSAGCSLGSLGALLRSRSMAVIFAGGVWNGFLPCGLVYAYLVLAASTGHVGSGAWVMLLFGLGTIPALVLTGLAGSLLGVKWRKQLFHIAAWCLVLTGAWTMVRGIGYLQRTEPTCPLCTEYAPQPGACYEKGNAPHLTRDNSATVSSSSTTSRVGSP